MTGDPTPWKGRAGRLRVTVVEDGSIHHWRFWREHRVGVGGAPTGWFWHLETHDGCVRVLETTWDYSVPTIRTILENYGVTGEVS